MECIGIFYDNEACVVCKSQGTMKVKFPAGCGHSFCVDCTKNLMFLDGSRYQLSSVPFGCPGCPNGCANPVKGRQCECDEYDITEKTWKFSEPEAWLRWNKAENKSIERGEEDLDTLYGTKKCPVCRVCYERLD